MHKATPSKRFICGINSLFHLWQQSDLSEAQEGDPKYLAPELMQGKFTKAADVFRYVYLYFDYFSVALTCVPSV